MLKLVGHGIVAGLVAFLFVGIIEGWLNFKIA